jgi:hypothetical protein
MAQFPISEDDASAVTDAVNYLLSGPTGAGQNLIGFQSDTATQLTGNFRPPYTGSQSCFFYNTIPLATATWLDPRTWRYDFAAAQPTPPLQPGNSFIVSGVTPSDYDGSFNRIGVVECTTTYVIGRTDSGYPDPGPGTGGQIDPWYNWTIEDLKTYISTDCNGKVTVTGGLDRVAITAQLNNNIFYSNPNTQANFLYQVSINRYKATPNNDPVNPEFIFNLDATVSKQLYSFDTTNDNPILVTDGGIVGSSLTWAGAKVAYVAPLDGAFDTAVDATFPGINATTGTGSNAEIRVEISYGAAGNYTAQNTRVTVLQPGEGWSPGATIVIPGTSIGGATPANDLTITVNAVTATSPTYLGNIETIFTGITDEPPPGYYWYIMEVSFESVSGGPVNIVDCDVGYRSLTAQVLKQ